jgi:hypothetical protein
VNANNKHSHIELNVEELVMRWKDSPQWNIIDVTHGEKLIQLVNTTLEVRYPKRSFSPSGQVKGGFQFYAAPELFPTKSIQFQYKMMFPETFNWVKGGKLPGVWFGEIGANGGEHSANGSSCRLMWREKGELEAYLYIPQEQHEDFASQPGVVLNKEYGASLWRGVFQAVPRVWNNVTMKIVMNTKSDLHDGLLSLTINNTTMAYEKLNWGVPDLNIQGLMMHTFFGGSDNSWATPSDQYAYFKDFAVTM